MRVVAGALVDGEGRVLIAQRPPGRWQAGRWEFPGGKLEAGESDQQALHRELLEELGVRVQLARPLLTVEHAYADRAVTISMWLVQRYDGSPAGLDGQQLQWLAPQELRQADLLEADRPIVAALIAALA